MGKSKVEYLLPGKITQWYNPVDLIDVNASRTEGLARLTPFVGTYLKSPLAHPTTPLVVEGGVLCRGVSLPAAPPAPAPPPPFSPAAAGPPASSASAAASASPAAAFAASAAASTADGRERASGGRRRMVNPEGGSVRRACRMRGGVAKLPLPLSKLPHNLCLSSATPDG